MGKNTKAKLSLTKVGALGALQKGITKLVLEDNILGIEHLSQAVRMFSTFVSHVIVDATASRHGKEQRIVSFCIEAKSQKSIKSFDTSSDFQKALLKVTKQKPSLASGKFFKVYYLNQPDQTVSKSVERCFLAILQTIFISSVQFSNIKKDNQDTVIERARDLAVHHVDDLEQEASVRIEQMLNDLSILNPIFTESDVVFCRANLKPNTVTLRGHYSDELRLGPQFRAAIARCVRTRNAVVHRLSKKSIIIFPLDQSDYDRMYRFSMSALVVSADLIKTNSQFEEVSLTIQTYIREYKQALNNAISHQLETHLASRVRNASISLGWNSFEEFIASAFGLIGRALLFSVNAHSLVFRKFVANERVLSPSIEIFEHEGVRSSGSKRNISVSDSSTSCNAFTFRFCSYDEGAVYLPNVKSIPSIYSARGLKRIFRVRNLTSSELTLPFFIRDVPIGTINLESPRKENFVQDIHFVVRLIRTIGRYAEAFIASHDAVWIGQISQVRAAVHEARQIVFAELNDPDRKPLGATNVQNVQALSDLLDEGLRLDMRQVNGNLWQYIRGVIEEIGLGSKPNNFIVG